MTLARMAAIKYERLQVDDGTYHCDDCDADCCPKECDAIKPS
ncbi:hypothetical protein MANY_36680 [Mycolicibacterium anyangense]|uniref:Uncharacterized protein n=1 Tax=Mycolicibacterium anyangense TaxID=1431246 RepID=A0A6N4WGK7_9MYCO|nr:hypothetical protein MANY_36680 [Mycolicibacterium anyangense]